MHRFGSRREFDRGGWGHFWRGSKGSAQFVDGVGGDPVGPPCTPNEIFGAKFFGLDAVDDFAENDGAKRSAVQCHKPDRLFVFFCPDVVEPLRRDACNDGAFSYI